MPVSSKHPAHFIKRDRIFLPNVGERGTGADFEAFAFNPFPESKFADWTSGVETDSEEIEILAAAELARGYVSGVMAALRGACLIIRDGRIEIDFYCDQTDCRFVAEPVGAYLVSECNDDEIYISSVTAGCGMETITIPVIDTPRADLGTPATNYRPSLHSGIEKRIAAEVLGKLRTAISDEIDVISDSYAS